MPSSDTAPGANTEVKSCSLAGAFCGALGNGRKAAGRMRVDYLTPEGMRVGNPLLLGLFAGSLCPNGLETGEGASGQRELE